MAKGKINAKQIHVYADWVGLDGPKKVGILHADSTMAAPPFTSLRTLEEASLQLEKEDAIEDPAFAHWLNLLIFPGSSLGGARPKASVMDPTGQLWIAKFPSRKDDHDMGGWEIVVNDMASAFGGIYHATRGFTGFGYGRTVAANRVLYSYKQ